MGQDQAAPAGFDGAEDKKPLHLTNRPGTMQPHGSIGGWR